MKKIGLLIGFLFASASSYADVDCSGAVDSLSLQLNTHGTVTLSLSGGPKHVYICNMSEATVNGVSFEACKAIYSTLMAAKMANKKMLIRFYGYDSCASIPGWAYPGSLGWTKVLEE